MSCSVGFSTDFSCMWMQICFCKSWIASIASAFCDYKVFWPFTCELWWDASTCSPPVGLEVGTYFNKYHNYLVLSLPFGIWVFNIFGFRFPFATSSVMTWNGMMGAGYSSCLWFSFLRFHFNCILCCLLWEHKS